MEAEAEAEAEEHGAMTMVVAVAVVAQRQVQPLKRQGDRTTTEVEEVVEVDRGQGAQTAAEAVLAMAFPSAADAFQLRQSYQTRACCIAALQRGQWQTRDSTCLTPSPLPVPLALAKALLKFPLSHSSR